MRETTRVLGAQCYGAEPLQNLSRHLDDEEPEDRAPCGRD